MTGTTGADPGVDKPEFDDWQGVFVTEPLCVAFSDLSCSLVDDRSGLAGRLSSRATLLGVGPGNHLAHNKYNK